MERTGRKVTLNEAMTRWTGTHGWMERERKGGRLDFEALITMLVRNVEILIMYYLTQR